MRLPTTQTNAHVLIADLTVKMANEVYEESATRHDSFAKLNPDRRKYVNMVAPTLVQEARQILATMLGDDSLSPDEKDIIFEALMLDASIPRADKRGSFKRPLFIG